MKIAIAGYGTEGKANYNYWSKSENSLTIVDEIISVTDCPYGASIILGDDAFSELADFDMVVRTAGLNPGKITTNGKIWSATNEFFTKCPAPIIGVTGTKGKGTTSSLIACILRAAGKTVHLVGNIGTPALDVLDQIKPDDIVVYELSSFQLWDAQASPQVAVVLPIEPDHLEVHADMAEYVTAKSNITKFQKSSDSVVFHSENQYSQSIANNSAAKNKISYPFEIEDFVGSLQLPGSHNIENASAAIAAARIFDVSDEAIHQGLRDFTGLPHRLKFVAQKNDVKYYDDSIATTPGSAIAAMRSFDEPKIIILGGASKGAEYDEVIAVCKETDTQIVAIGETATDIFKLATVAEVGCIHIDGTMKEIVGAVSQKAAPGSVVLLSPAASSFDMFKNYSDRGEQFISAVGQLAD